MGSKHTKILNSKICEAFQDFRKCGKLASYFEIGKYKNGMSF